MRLFHLSILNISLARILRGFRVNILSTNIIIILSVKEPAIRDLGVPFVVCKCKYVNDSYV